eukprot:488072_1
MSFQLGMMTHTLYPTNNVNKRRSRNPMLWDSTYLNDKNPSNIFLYVPKEIGTTPISVPPSQYISTLTKYGMSLESLNIPPISPSFQDSKANQTALILWNIVESERLKRKTLINENGTDGNMSINDKLDWIMNTLKGTSDSDKHIQQVEMENNILKENLEQKNKKIIEKDTRIDQLQQTLWNTEQTVHETIQENKRLKQEKIKKIKEKYYWKTIAINGRKELKYVGLKYNGNISGHCSKQTLMKTVNYLTNYLNR